MTQVNATLADSILLLTITRPDVYNVIDADTCSELAQHLDDARDNDNVRVIVITGAGDKAFCAGFDLSYAERNPEVYKMPMFASELVRRPPGDKPVIAAINGMAMGLGFELALACDLIVASSHATFALPEPKVGLAAMGGGVARLAKTIGSKRALGIALTSRVVAAQEALQLGIINEVVEGNVVMAAHQWARQIVVGGPLSIAATQQIARLSSDMALADALDPRNYPAVMTLLDSSDAEEGRRAFLAKRKPEWKNC